MGAGEGECTIGPSRPMGNPLATTSVTPTTLASNVSNVKMLGMFTPLRKALRSGSPDEAAEGAQ